MPGVTWSSTLDPARSRQTNHPAIYATSSVDGALVHAILKHQPEDIGESSGQTYALDLEGSGTVVQMSPKLREAASNNTLRFTGGYLYVLPADEFSASWQASNHEVAATREVTPLLGIKVGEALGSELMKRIQTAVFIEDMESKVFK